MGRAGFKEIVSINRLDEAGWLRTPRRKWAEPSWRELFSSDEVSGIMTLTWLTVSDFEGSSVPQRQTEARALDRFTAGMDQCFLVRWRFNVEQWLSIFTGLLQV